MNNPFQGSFQCWAEGGFLLIPIGLVCFFIWFYFLKLNYRLKGALSDPPGLEDELQRRLADGEGWDEIKEFASKLNKLFFGIIIYVVEKTTQGVSLSDIFNEVRQKEFSLLERDIVVLTALVTSAPLLGLLGTVLGMINTFQAITLRAAGTTELMASGISQALITTQFGLIVALPGIFGVSLLKRQLRQLEVRFSTLQHHLTLGLRRKTK